MRNFEINFRKVSRLFSRELNLSEHEERVQYATKLSQYLINHETYIGWINEVRLFGSLARNMSRIVSDIDLAFIATQVTLFGANYQWLHMELEELIDNAKPKLGIPAGLVIHPTIIQESWLRDPDWTTDSPGVIHSINRDSVVLVQK